MALIQMENQQQAVDALVVSIHYIIQGCHIVKFTVKPVFFMCPLFCDLGEIAKVTGTNMLFLVYYVLQQAKKHKIKGAKII